MNKHASLKDIWANAKNTSLAMTAEALDSLEIDLFSAAEKQQILNWMLISGKYEKYKSIVSRINRNSFSPQEQGKLFAAELRYALLAQGAVPDFDKVLPVPRWVEAFRSTSEDIAYPTEIVLLKFMYDDNYEVRPQINIVCLSCRSTIETTLASDMLPYRSKKVDYWHCPHCLARCEYDPVSIRERIFVLYDDFFKKLPKDSKGLLQKPVAAFAYLYAVSLRPLGLIRFLNLYTNRIGHYVLNTAIYVADRLMPSCESSLDYIGIAPGKAVSNDALTTLWDRILQLTPAAGQICASVANSEHSFQINKAQDNLGSLERYPMVFPFTCHENEEALKFMEKMGIPRGSKYVCWHCRTKHYLESILDKSVKPASMQYYRCMELKTFKKSIDFLISKGYYVIRMGTEATSDLPWRHNKLIDYAKQFHSDFMDIWLFSHADLTLSTASGPDIISLVSHRQGLYVGFAPLGYVSSFTHSMTNLFQHYYREGTDERMTLGEVLSSGYATDQNDLLFKKNGYYLIQNTEDEVLSAVQEKVYLIEGGKRSDEDIFLENAFWRLFENNRDQLVCKYSQPPLLGTQLHGPEYHSHVSSVFLHQYRDELLRVK